MSTMRVYSNNSAPDLSTICRLCLQFDSGTINIFDSGPLSIPVRIMACAALESQSSDGLPKLICNDCRFQLEKSYYFRKKCQLSDAKLRKHFRLLNAGKKSRVFSKPNADDDDEEHDFEESIKFIREEEDKVRREEERKRAKWLEEQQEQFRKEETQRLFEEFGNFMNSRKPIERKATLKQERIDLEIAPPEKQPLLSPPRERTEEIVFKRPKVKTVPRKPKEDPITTEADNEITSSEQMPEEQEQILIYNDEEVENTDGTIQTFFLYEKTEGDGNGQIIEIESDQLNDELREELQQECEEDANEEANMDMNAHEEPEEDFMFASEYDDSENREEDGHHMDTANSVQSYQIEENGDIQFLKHEVAQETFSISDDDEQNMLDNPDTTQYEEETIVMPAPKPKLKRKAAAATDTSAPKEKKAVTATSLISINYAKITTEDLKIFKCSECPQSFTRENSLLRHSSAHKKGGREYSCAKCDKWFSCKSSLDRHVRIHTGEKPFTCDECGKSYMQKEVLKRHLAIHSGERPHPCPHCPRAFVQKLMLTQHINATHLEVPQIQKHDCHLCSKSFLHASGLSRHLITHSGMKFRCSECGRSFNDKSSIRRHVSAVHAITLNQTTIVATRGDESPSNYII